MQHQSSDHKNVITPSNRVLRGSLYIGVGILLLLHALGFMHTVLTILLALIATGLIVYGVKESGLYEKLSLFFSKKK